MGIDALPAALNASLAPSPVRAMRIPVSAPVLGTLLIFVISHLPVGVKACTLSEPPLELENTFWVHVEGPCMPAEQAKLAVRGADLLHALKQGWDVDLEGVVVVDDVMLDLLPLHKVSDSSNIPAAVRTQLQQRRVEVVRIIPGSLSIRHSRIENVLATNLVEGALLMLQAVDFTGSVFQQSVDFSKTMFVGPVTFFKVRVDYEGFFIGAQFGQPVNFSHMTFGTHSRFHKAGFAQTVTFADSLFTGVAEFLEVEFQRKANFSHSHFSNGTGFSGSVFNGPADFSAITADHEIYYRFTEFKQGVSFQNAEFHKVVDFSNARFEGGENFSGVDFAVSPSLAGSNLSPGEELDEGWQGRKTQLGIFAGLLILVLFYLWMTREKKRA